MNAVYRIEVQHRPQDVNDWYASAWRISDDSYMSGSTQVADSADEAVRKVCDWIATDHGKQDGFTVYTDEAGEVISEHSVKS